jgi:hypothetical protein
MDKKNIDAIDYGNKDGQISFGRLHLANDGGTESDVTSDVMLQGSDSRHYMTMDKDGKRKGWTLNRCPGVYEIKCGTDVKKDQPAFFMMADNGDIIIHAPNGRIRMDALDIDILAHGTDNTRGTINIESNQSVNIKTGSFDLYASTGVKLFTPKSMNMIANTSMGLVSNFVNGLTAASSTKPSKSAPITQSTGRFNEYQSYTK